LSSHWASLSSLMKWFFLMSRWSSSINLWTCEQALNKRQTLWCRVMACVVVNSFFNVEWNFWKEMTYQYWIYQVEYITHPAFEHITEVIEVFSALHSSSCSLFCF
jgi:uncharacterized membrane protein YbaN (DUF454 family)